MRPAIGHACSLVLSPTDRSRQRTVSFYTFQALPSAGARLPGLKDGEVHVPSGAVMSVVPSRPAQYPEEYHAIPAGGATRTRAKSVATPPTTSPTMLGIIVFMPRKADVHGASVAHVPTVAKSTSASPSGCGLGNTGVVERRVAGVAVVEACWPAPCCTRWARRFLPARVPVARRSWRAECRSTPPTQRNQMYTSTHARQGIVVEGIRSAGAPMATPTQASTPPMDAAGSHTGRACCEGEWARTDAAEGALGEAPAPDDSEPPTPAAVRAPAMHTRVSPSASLAAHITHIDRAPPPRPAAAAYDTASQRRVAHASSSSGTAASRSR